MLPLIGKIFATPKELHAANVLSINYRNFEVISKSNKRRLYPLVDDKLKTKKLARAAKINTPRLLGVISYQFQAKHFLRFIQKHKEFVMKPANGSGGKGVLVITSYQNDTFTTASGKILSYHEVYQHLSNILSGLYSLGGQPDSALFEEVVHFSNIFKKFSFQGVPDVRIIVYRGYPIFSMIRLATKESGGRANLHQGAVGVGLDIATGKALAAVQHNRPLERHPDTDAVLTDIHVPYWKEHLLIAAKGFDMTSLGYIGADIVLDKERGPMMLELNARPGLAIQIANGCGMRHLLKDVQKKYPKGLTAEERVQFVMEQK